MIFTFGADTKIKNNLFFLRQISPEISQDKLFFVQKLKPHYSQLEESREERISREKEEEKQLNETNLDFYKNLAEKQWPTVTKVFQSLFRVVQKKYIANFSA